MRFEQESYCVPVQITCDVAAVQFEPDILSGSNRTAIVQDPFFAVPESDRMGVHAHVIQFCKSHCIL